VTVRLPRPIPSEEIVNNASDIDIYNIVFDVELMPEDRPTGRTPTCPPFCVQHYAGDAGRSLCFAQDEQGPGGVVTLGFFAPQGMFLNIYCKTENLTPEETRQLTAALHAQADRAEQARALFTFPK
jgi:hypothetical protein